MTSITGIPSVNLDYIIQKCMQLPYFQVIMKMQKIVSITIFFSIMIFAIISFPSSSAHILVSTIIQERKDVKNNIDILLSYKPEKPIIDAFTKLEFSVTNLKTGEHLHDFIARITVTNGKGFSNFKTLPSQMETFP